MESIGKSQEDTDRSKEDMLREHASEILALLEKKSRIAHDIATNNIHEDDIDKAIEDFEDSQIRIDSLAKLVCIAIGEIIGDK